MTEQTDVDVDVVLEFASRLHARATDVAQEVGSLQLPIAGANLGASSMQESAAAAGSYAAAVQSTTQFLRDVQDGLLSLSYVSATVAQNYRAGDNEQAASMGTVSAAFAPGPGQVTIASSRTVAVDPELQRFRNQVTALIPALGTEEQRLRNQLDAGRRTPAGSPADRYSRATDAVAAHDELIGDDGVLAEGGYHPTADHQQAEATAALLTDEHHIPYTVVVDDHGVSTVVQADPDDVPAPDPEPDAVDERDEEAADLAAALGGAG